MKNTKNNKKIRWWVPQMGAKELGLVRQVIERNYPNEGEFTTAFENEAASLLGVRHALAVTSGTAAIFLSLKSLGVGHGDEVIVPDITFIATANAVEMCGAKPVLADVDPNTMNIGLQPFLRAVTNKTKAVVPVHVSGRASDMEGILKIAGQKNIFVVEDAAEAFMSRHKGKFLGTFGKTGCFSFSPHKTITTGQGGMVVTDDDILYVKLKELKDQGRPVRGTGGDDKHNCVGYNFKFTDLQAAVGLGQLTHLKRRVEKMRDIYERYRKGLRDVKEAAIFDFDIKAGELPQWTDVLIEERDLLDQYLRKRGIDCRRYWFPIHTQAPYSMPDRGFPNSTSLSPKALWLPSAFTMTGRDVEKVCRSIKDFFASI